MNRYDFTVTKPVEYHVSVEAETAEDAWKEIERRKATNNYKAYATTEGVIQSALNSVEDLTPKEYRVRVTRTLYKEITLEARCEDEAIDFAIDELNDMGDEELDVYDSDAEILEVIRETDGKEG